MGLEAMTGGRPSSKKFIRFSDTRKIDAATGKPLNETNRLSSDKDIDMDVVHKVIAASKKYGENPGTILAMGLAENQLQKINGGSGYSKYAIPDDYFTLHYDDDLPHGEKVMDSARKVGGIETFIKAYKQTQAYAKAAAKKNGRDPSNMPEEELIQSWNGFGPVRGQGMMYGIDTNKTPIDMRKTLMYGKKIKDIRDNIIMKHPEIAKLLAPPEPVAAVQAAPSPLISMQRQQIAAPQAPQSIPSNPGIPLSL